MASQGSRGRHLDAGAGREVVYCHACSHEWFRDDHGLDCPRCESDITEIISPENDPRDLAPSSTPSSPDLPPSRHADDSDPDEADIEEHMGPQGIRFRRSTRSRSDQRHHDPSIDPVFERFYDMIQNFGQAGSTTRAGGSSIFGRANDETFVAPRIQRTTFTSGTLGGGTASVTIFSSPAFTVRVGNSGEGQQGGEHQDQEGADPFQTLFSNIIRDIPPPSASGGEQGRPTGPQPGFARGLQEILNLFHPANAMVGDAVYSQEAFDSIITQLMEANPQSNAAPPASEEALLKLDRRPVDRQMLEPEGEVECSICIDEMKIGETAVFLRCKHWFHEDCVVLWLKEHNTCPVCRTPIEKNNRGANRSGAGGSSSSDRAGRPGNNPGQSSNSSPHLSRNNSDQTRGGFGGQHGSGADTPTGRAAADMVSSIYVGSHNRPTNRRLGEALERVESMQRERNEDGSQSRATTASGFSYDTSRMQRRTSHSPTSPRTANLAEQGARMRQRSPSESNRRGNTDRDGRRQSGPGPWGWIRDRFTGSGSSGGPSDSHGQGGQS
ncbi:hypothetical protein E4U43_002205 [Claviceps pusilla]|uniref:RING-type E3 ubiquitin transferase n=1 Tax=Claviceps pusilla TaxID=123648 RepID=A0A9P7NFX2_9HYPO|nr:hypothetical protein E4U43_002205 [Claviceps pusilla]